MSDDLAQYGTVMAITTAAITVRTDSGRQVQLVPEDFLLLGVSPVQHQRVYLYLRGAAPLIDAWVEWSPCRRSWREVGL